MKKTTYWKDVWRTFVASKGRMLSPPRIHQTLRPKIPQTP